MHKNLYCNTMLEDGTSIISLAKNFNNDVLTLHSDHFFRNIIYVYYKYNHTLLRVLSDNVLHRILFDTPPADCAEFVYGTIYPVIIVNCILYDKAYMIEGLKINNIMPDDFYDIIYDYVVDYIYFRALDDFSMVYDYTFNSSGWRLRDANDSSTILLYILDVSKTLYDKLMPFLVGGTTMYLNGFYISNLYQKDKNSNNTHAMEIAWRLQEVLKRVVQKEQLNHNIILYDSKNNATTWDIYDDNPFNNLIYKHLINGGE